MDEIIPRTIDFDGADIVVQNGAFRMAYGKDCYLVQIHTALKTLLGEIILNPGEGLDYFGTAFNVNAQVGVAVWAQRLRDRVLKFPFVQKIKKFEYGMDDARHRLEYELVVETDDGTVTDTNIQTAGSDNVPDDKDLPIASLPMRGTTSTIDTTEDVYNTAAAISKATGVSVPLENDEDVYVATKSFVEFLGGKVT